MKLGYEELPRHVCFMHMHMSTWPHQLKWNVFMECNAENFDATDENKYRTESSSSQKKNARQYYNLQKVIRSVFRFHIYIIMPK